MNPNVLLTYRGRSASMSVDGVTYPRHEPVEIDRETGMRLAVAGLDLEVSEIAGDPEQPEAKRGKKAAETPEA